MYKWYQTINLIWTSENCGGNNWVGMDYDIKTWAKPVFDRNQKSIAIN